MADSYIGLLADRNLLLLLMHGFTAASEPEIGRLVRWTLSEVFRLYLERTGEGPDEARIFGPRNADQRAPGRQRDRAPQRRPGSGRPHPVYLRRCAGGRRSLPVDPLCGSSGETDTASRLGPAPVCKKVVVHLAFRRTMPESGCGPTAGQ